MTCRDVRDVCASCRADLDEWRRVRTALVSGQFSRQFTQPGTFKYFCSLHPRMTGTVVVA